MISHRRSVYLTSFFVTMLLCWLPTIALPAIALPAIAQTSSAPPSKLGTISGSVVDESGRPLPNARIMLRPLGSMEPESINTTTDREGRFELGGLKPVSYQIFAFLQGYALRVLDGTQPGACRIGDFVTLTLTKGGVITGTVTNQTGEPIVGVNVRALMVHVTSHLPYPYNSIGLADLTDDRGIYRIYGLPEGTYVVWAGGGGESRYTTNIDPFDSDVPTYAPASTRETAQEIIVRAGAETTNVDIQYRGGSGHTISGRALGPDGNQPLQFAINLVSADGPSWGTTSFQGPADRGFMLQGVDDGDYNIVAISYRQDGEFMLSPATQIKVRGADVSGVELIVQPLSSVAGRVVLEETRATECSDKQRPAFTETLISAQSNAPETSAGISSFLWPTANADETGNVLLKNLQPGRYYFTTRYFAKDWFLKSLSIVPSETGKPLDVARTWTTVKPGDRLKGLTITLSHGAASLRGQIALSKGETLAEKLYAYLVPAERERADDPLRFYGETVTAEGKVALNNLAPGRYWVFARRATNESVLPLAKLRSPDATTYRARLRREAETVKAEIELKPCQKLTDVKIRLRID